MTLPHSITWSPRNLAAHLAENAMPGQRSMTAIIRLRRERRARNTPTPPTPTLQERLNTRIYNSAIAEILRRGGETVIWGKGNSRFDLFIEDRRDRMTLLRAQGWRYYSSRAGSHRATLAYLYGIDDAGPWAVRVPGTVTTVSDAIDWLTPQEVRNAIRGGVRVRRQGDIYAIETSARFDGDGAELLPPAHQWRPETRHLIHTPEDGRKHKPLRLPYPVRFVRQRVYEMGRSGGRAYGD